jgi:hypothetical protein
MFEMSKILPGLSWTFPTMVFLLWHAVLDLGSNVSPVLLEPSWDSSHSESLSRVRISCLNEQFENQDTVLTLVS